MSDPLDWCLERHEIGDRGLAASRSASEAERAAIAAALDLVACGRLEVVYRIKPAGSQRLRLDGRIEAAVTQACVITLEPVDAELSIPIAVELANSDDLELGPDFDAIADDDVEPLGAAGEVPLGRLVYEHLAAALDPYPRKPGAELTWRDEKGEAASRAASPFAALGKLRAKDD